DEITQDPDVLDTWFSSALWPFSTLGWPEETEDFKTFYPTDVLVTGFDIIFFWVARMVMTGMHFTGQTPFHAVHLTGLVRDAEGQKMSKTRGNTVDPLELVEEYGADAVRFTLAILDSPGRDIPLDPDRMAGYRSFGNKIWNAVRFSLSRVGSATVQESLDVTELAAPERWILSRLSKTAAEVNERFAEYRFDEACQRLYHFFWGELCDWYIELSKPALTGESPRPQVGEVLLTVLDRSLRLLHPVMPFLTEELWQRLPGREAIHPATICLAPYPVGEEAWRDPVTEERMDVFFQIVAWARNLRAELGIPPRDKATLYISSESSELAAFLGRLEAMALPLLRLDAVHFEAAPDGAHSDVVAGVAVGLVVPERELSLEDRERLMAEREKLRAQHQRTLGLLENKAFLAKAPEKVVDQNRRRLEEILERLEILEAGLAADEPGSS
ncbi:MAG: class I tRNA ligase family protein, partial [Nitrospirae bacterium]|nr:class I tRNA ligase family protein [Nitrospirota bacterium]